MVNYRDGDMRRFYEVLVGNYLVISSIVCVYFPNKDDNINKPIDGEGSQLKGVYQHVRGNQKLIIILPQKIILPSQLLFLNQTYCSPH